MKEVSITCAVNRIFSLSDKELGVRLVIDLERVCAIESTSSGVRVIFENESIYIDLSTNIIDKLFQQFVAYKTDCHCTPPLKKPLPTSGTEIKAM